MKTGGQTPVADTAKPRKSYYSKALKPTIETLETIAKLCDTFPDEGVQRLFYGLGFKHFDIPSVERLNAYIAESIGKINTEKNKFNSFLKNKFPQYATDQNDYPNSIYTVMRHLGSHLAPLKNVLGKFCTHEHTNLPECEKWGVPQKYVIDMSMLTGGACEGSIFKLDSYPQEVKTLVSNLTDMFRIIGSTIDEAQQALLEDDKVRANPFASMARFDEYGMNFCRGIHNIIDLVKYISPSEMLKNNAFYKAEKEADTREAAVQAGYHRHDTKTMDNYFLCQCLSEITQLDITDEEQRAWPADRASILKMRIIIDNFDALIPEGTNDREFSMYIYMFCAWTGNNSVKAIYNCFKSRYCGSYPVRTYNIINGYRGTVEPKSAMYTQFTQAIETLLNKPENKKLWSQNKG